MALKEDFKPVRVSEHRVANRETVPISTRYARSEIAAIESVATQNGVKKSDVIRGALAYVGVIDTNDANGQQVQSA